MPSACLWICLVDRLLRGVLHLVDVAGVLALGFLVDDVAGFVDRGFHLVGVLRYDALHLVQKSHAVTLQPRRAPARGADDHVERSGGEPIATSRAVGVPRCQPPATTTNFR